MVKPQRVLSTGGDDAKTILDHLIRDGWFLAMAHDRYLYINQYGKTIDNEIACPDQSAAWKLYSAGLVGTYGLYGTFNVTEVFEVTISGRRALALGVVEERITNLRVGGAR